MAFIDDDQVIVSPVQTVQVQAVGTAVGTGKVGMEQHVVAQAVAGDGVVGVVVLIGVPVPCQLFGAEDQHGLIAVFIVLDHRECRERLAKAHAVSQDAAVVFFQLVDDGKYSVPLEVIQQAPDFALLEARRLIGKNILRNVLQEFVENVIQRNEIDQLRRVFGIGSRNVFDYRLRHILEFFPIPPKGLEQLHVLRGEGGFKAVDHVIAVVAPLTSDIDRSEPVQRHVSDLIGRRVHSHKPAHVFASSVGLEVRFPTDPICAFPGDGLLRHLIAELDLKLRAIQALLAGQTRDIEFALLLLRFLRNEGRRGENETEIVHRLQLRLQFIVRIHGKTSSGDGYLAACLNGLRHIVTDDLGYIIKDFHDSVSLPLR